MITIQLLTRRYSHEEITEVDLEPVVEIGINENPTVDSSEIEGGGKIPEKLPFGEVYVTRIVNGIECFVKLSDNYEIGTGKDPRFASMFELRKCI